MKSLITTAGIAPASRSSHWHQAIADTYFPLDIQFADSDRFNGELVNWRLGDVSLSRLTAEGTRYRRMPRHLVHDTAEDFLITVPAKAEVHFSQCGKDVRCNPGGFIIERSDEPYDFSHAEAADLWVVKVGASALAGRIRAPNRFCSLQFDATNGAGGLFVDMLQHIPHRFDAMSSEVRSTVGQQLIDLLALALHADERTLTAGNSSVREAHLTRIESFVRTSIGNPDLAPEAIAAACGISTRYLHELFRDTNQTLGQWIRDQRLNGCREDLKDPANRQTIAEIAYQWGFSDQAQFSRSFRAHFGLSPKEFRAMHRQPTKG